MKEPISTKFGRLLGKLIKKAGKVTKNVGVGVAQELKPNINKKDQKK